MMTTKRYGSVAAGIALIGLAAYAAVGFALGDDAAANDDDYATCLVDTVDCVDADLGGDAAGEGPVEQEARVLLGMSEADLPDDVRIGRRGAEHMMLTEDYVLGRMTVSLEDIDDSGYRVVDVTVELPNGTATYELQAG